MGSLEVKAFQELWNQHNPGDAIAVDGLWGPATATRVDRLPAMGFGAPITLRRGMMNTEVGSLQLMLRKALNLTPEQLPADSQFGSATERQVTEFQQAKGLTADGIAGAETIKALEEATGEKLILA